MLIMLITVDFEKMIEDDHEHCCGAEEEGEGVEGGVGDHFLFCFCLFSGFLGGVRGEVVDAEVVVWFSGGLVWWWWWWIGVVDWCGGCGCGCGGCGVVCCVLGFNGEG